MTSGLFLVARFEPEALGEDVEWLAGEDSPFESADPLDFLESEIGPIFKLYKATYGKLGPLLNVQMPGALLEYNRWVLMVDEEGDVLAFACFKTTQWGVKLGLAAADLGARSSAAKDALKRMLRKGLNVDGVYAEVSDRLELVLSGDVPEVPPDLAERILGKATTEDADGRHYSRDVTNVGRKRKLMVGRPFQPEIRDQA